MAKQTQVRRTPPRRSRTITKSTELVFKKGNYVWLLVGVAIIVTGYTLMAAENELKGFISLYVAPLIILAGYIEIIFAILWRPRRAEQVQG